MRLFVAAELPAAVRSELAARAAELVGAGGWRAVRPDGLHVTLAFLGERPDSDVAGVAAVLRGCARALPATALTEELLLPPRSPRVCAVGLLDPEGSLAALQADVGAGLEELGVWRPERRRWLPHATIARRAKGPLGRAGAVAWRSGTFFLPAVTLFRSRLHPHGARYEALETVALAAQS